MKGREHLVISLAVSGILYLIFRSAWVSLWSLAGGTLIDIDHLYDYARYTIRSGRGGVDLGHFFEVLHQNKLQRVYVLLHSWELVAVLLVVGRIWGRAGAALIPVGFGMATHLLADALSNQARILSYSVIARACHGFAGDFFFAREG
ncbi:MAG: hypothetical protein NT045_06090 [Candidatus Aureabacteria bacterium]|nr:hypothetical protein [Candidatus Auribacterota bacterium]